MRSLSRGTYRLKVFVECNKSNDGPRLGEPECCLHAAPLLGDRLALPPGHIGASATASMPAFQRLTFDILMTLERGPNGVPFRAVARGGSGGPGGAAARQLCASRETLSRVRSSIPGG